MMKLSVLRKLYKQGFDKEQIDKKYLRGADLHGVNLRGADLNWNSHDLIAEILRQNISQDMCWEDFMGINDPLKEWAIDILRQWRNCPIKIEEEE